MFKTSKEFCTRCGVRVRSGMIAGNSFEFINGLFCEDCSDIIKQNNINEYKKKR